MECNMKKLNSLTFFLFFSTSAMANVEKISDATIKNDDVKSVKIIYTGNVTEKNIVELMASIDEVNSNYHNLENIYLYINSGGGDMSSGYMGYESVKNSRTPITTINAAMVGSAATLFYCAAKKREVMPLASFLLHAASVKNITQQIYLQPNHIEESKQYVEYFNSIFRSVYKTCTNYNGMEIDKILFSEDNHKLIDAKHSVSKKIANMINDQVRFTSVSYYIHSDNDNSE